MSIDRQESDVDEYEHEQQLWGQGTLNTAADEMEKPLQAAVLCCTSIPPEQRTHMAEAAIQMGAEHKLDLTSDVTHLIVGDSNTPKYKYVAREREDIKALQLEWVEALRQAWMAGDDVDLEALETKYRVPPFADLRICVTGFEDLNFRAQLQKLISDNGGEYRGDLTKEVTHLIARQAEGKKYQFATQWKIKVVSLRWLEDSLLRRMILEESLFHPSIPPDQIGVGAWHRQAEPRVRPGKRNRGEEVVVDLPRQLRRTASARLGSQSESLWGEIVSGPGPRQSEKFHPPRIAASLSASEAMVLEQESFATETTLNDGESRRLAHDKSFAPPLQQSRTGTFAGSAFLLHAFTTKQASVLREHLLSNDGESVETVTDLSRIATPSPAPTFLVIPHHYALNSIPRVKNSDTAMEVVTDLWAERCLLSKRFFHPDEHLLSRPIPAFPLPGFEKLTINTTGFADVDLLQVCKVVKLLGATFDQVLKPGISLLVCNTEKAGEDKLRHAREWRIPSVSIEWLWSCIRSGQLQPSRPFLFQQGHGPQLQQEVGAKRKSTASTRTAGAVSIEERDDLVRDGGQAVQTITMVTPRSSVAPEARMRTSKLMRGEGFSDSPSVNSKNVLLDGEENGNRTNLGVASHGSGPHHHHRRAHGAQIQFEETSANPAATSSGSISQHNAPQPQHPDGKPSQSKDQQQDGMPVPEPAALSVGESCHPPPPSASITGAIKELLNKSKSKGENPPHLGGGGRKKRLFGNALSNLSTSSREGSNFQASRASSIDSVNTDGLGTVILDEASQPKRAHGSTSKSNGGFAGHVPGAPAELGDAALYREEYVEDEEPPQMTQLGYENPDEAVALREKLAERKRNRCGQDMEDSKPPEPREGKKIKDDIPVAYGGRGVIRRTRQSARSP